MLRADIEDREEREEGGYQERFEKNKNTKEVCDVRSLLFLILSTVIIIFKYLVCIIQSSQQAFLKKKSSFTLTQEDGCMNGLSYGFSGGNGSSRRINRFNRNSVGRVLRPHMMDESGEGGNYNITFFAIDKFLFLICGQSIFLYSIYLN